MRFNVYFIVVVVCSILFSVNVEGVYVQRGLETGTGTTISALASVSNASRAFVLFRANTPDPTPDDWQFTVDYNGSQMDFTRYDGGATSSTISWQLIEDESISVQRGTSTFVTGNATADIDISSVDLSHAFIIMHGRCNIEDNTANNAGFFSGNFTNSTSIHIERGNEGDCNATASWQVVEWDDATVYAGTDTFQSSTDTLLVNIGATVDLSKSFIYHSTASIGTDQGMDTNLIWGDFLSNSQIKFMKKPGTSLANANRIVTWYVITHPMMYLQHDTVYFGTSTTLDLNPVVMNRSFHVSNVWNTGGGQTYTNHMYTYYLTNETRFTITKQTGNQFDNVSWFLMEFNNPFTINLDFPPQDENFSTSTVDLNFTIIDEDHDIENCSLYTNSSGSWSLEETLFSPLSNSELNFTNTYADGSYLWNVHCVDLRGYSSWNATNRTFLVDTTPPLIYGLQNISITNESVLILGYTDELANGSVFYGTAPTNLNTSLASPLFSTYHTLSISDLVPLTQYFYNVTACDFYGNCAQIGPYNFTTTDTADTKPPIIFNITIYGVADYSAVVHWNTTEIANASLNYGTSLPLTNSIAEDTLYDQSHDVNASGLQVNTLYYFNVTSCDPSGNCNSSSISNFTTIDTLPPVTTLLTPTPNQDFDTAVWLDFNFSVNDSQTVDNCSLYTDISGVWNRSGFEVLPPKNTKLNITLLLNKTGSFIWNVLCYDNSSHSSWAESTNRTFTNAFPAPVFTNATQNVSNPTQKEDVQFNITITDTDLKNYTFSINTTGTWLNVSSGILSPPSANVSVTYNLLGSHKEVCYKWYAYDERNGVAESSEYCFTLASTPPNQSAPRLVSEFGYNTTTEVLECINQSTFDLDGDSVKNIYNWTSSNASTMDLVFNLMFEGDNATYAKDYSAYDNFGSGTDITVNATEGWDGFGAYYFNGITSILDMDSGTNQALLHDATTQVTVFFRYKTSDITSNSILFEEGGGVNGFNIYLEGGRIFVGIWNGGSGEWLNTTTTANEWHSIGLIYDGSSNLTLVHDNTTISRATSVASISGHSGGTNFGADDNTLTVSGLSLAYQGFIDDAYYWDSIIPANQLIEMHNNGFKKIHPDWTTTNEVWQCSIIPHDGEVSGSIAFSNTMTILPNIFPKWYNFSWTPEPVIAFENNTVSSFNITWLDFNGFRNVTIEHNFSGIPANYSMTNSGSTYSYSYTGVPPGNQTIQFHAIDRFGALNTSSLYAYLVINTTINTTENITLTQDVEIDWSPIAYSDNYTIYSSDDLTNNFTSYATGITDTNWTDNNADSVEERYYIISSNVNGTEFNTTTIIGKKDYSSKNNWSLITVPFNLSEWRLNNNTFNGLTIQTQPAECLVSIYKYDPILDCFSQTDRIGNEWYPATGCDNFTGNKLELSQGYWFLSNESCKISFAGTVENTTISQSLEQDYNVVGWFSSKNATLPTNGEPPTYPVDVSPANSVWLIIRYNDQLQRFEDTGHYDDWGWWPYYNADGTIQDFTSLEPMRSYYFVADNAATWTYPTR